MNKYPKCRDIYWITLDPAVGSESNKTRPAVIISNNINNQFSKRVIVAPIKSKIRKVFPFEVALQL